MLWILLVSFIFRLSFGLSLAMAWIPYREVTSGFYRVHLWVLLGLNTLAAMAVGSQGIGGSWLLILTVLAAIASYVGAVIWMYDIPKIGQGCLYLVALLDFEAALEVSGKTLKVVDLTLLSSNVLANVATSGALLGLTLSAMLLGHWYLNTPSMKLAPLKNLIVWLAYVLVARALLCGGGFLVVYWQAKEPASSGWWALVAIRWLAGICGMAVLSVMAWWTLKIPNTQSATGILYVAVIFSFLGELTSLMLGAHSIWAL